MPPHLRLSIPNLWICGEITTDNNFPVPTIEKSMESGIKCANLILGIKSDMGPIVNRTTKYKILALTIIVHLIALYFFFLFVKMLYSLYKKHLQKK